MADDAPKSIRPVDPSTQPPAVLGAACRYCGARLTQGFYFCLTCGTPYTSVESCLPAVPAIYESDGTLIAHKVPQVWTVFWAYLAVVTGTGIVSYAMFDGERRDLTVLLGSAGIFVTTCIFGVRHWKALWVQLRRSGFLEPSAWVAILALAPLLAINYAYHRMLLPKLGLDTSTQSHAPDLSQAAMILFICILPAINEEIAFRGLVQHWLMTALRPARAIVLASALFTALHFSVLSAPYLFTLGALLGWARWKTGSLYPSMLIHFLHNLVVVVYF